MRKVLVFSVLLVLGLAGSQMLPALLGEAAQPATNAVRILTMVCLAFIMVHVGLEFDIDKSNLRQYGWDYVVAATAATFPWLLCCAYFVLVMLPQADWASWVAWKESLLASRFAAPTSAGVLFSMLAAAGLGATWLFRKARVLAIFDDLDTVLLMIPLKAMIVGVQWQLAAIVAAMLAVLWLGWKFLNCLRLPVTWGWVLTYSTVIVLVTEAVYLASKSIDQSVPIHVEVLLPAFVLGCVIRTRHRGGYSPEAAHDHPMEQPTSPTEQIAATLIAGAFMVLVGLSMPAFIGTQAAETAMTPVYVSGPNEGLSGAGDMSWGVIGVHVLLITLLSNLGKMFPVLCYRREATLRERLAVAIGMWPRGEVGAGVLVISLSYGITGPIVTVAMLSLALNLLLTGVFIVAIRRLIAPVYARSVAHAPGAGPAGPRERGDAHASARPRRANNPA